MLVYQLNKAFSMEEHFHPSFLNHLYASFPCAFPLDAVDTTTHTHTHKVGIVDKVINTQHIHGCICMHTHM